MEKFEVGQIDLSQHTYQEQNYLPSPRVTSVVSEGDYYSLVWFFGNDRWPMNHWIYIEFNKRFETRVYFNYINPEVFLYVLP